MEIVIKNGNIDILEGFFNYGKKEKLNPLINIEIFSEESGYDFTRTTNVFVLAIEHRNVNSFKFLINFLFLKQNHLNMEYLGNLLRKNISEFPNDIKLKEMLEVYLDIKEYYEYFKSFNGHYFPNYKREFIGLKEYPNNLEFNLKDKFESDFKIKENCEIIEPTVEIVRKYLNDLPKKINLKISRKERIFLNGDEVRFSHSIIIDESGRIFKLLEGKKRNGDGFEKADSWLGSGSFSLNVKIAENLETNEKVVVKVINKIRNSEKRINQEFSIAEKLKKNRGRADIGNNKVYLFLELEQGIRLADYNFYNSLDFCNMFVSLIKQVEQLLQKNLIAHGDLQKNNILIDKDLNVALVDFGNACELHNVNGRMVDYGEKIVFIDNAAPEMREYKNKLEIETSFETDIFAVGKIVEKILKKNDALKKDFILFQNLIKKMTDKDFDKRPSVKQILKELNTIQRFLQLDHESLHERRFRALNFSLDDARIKKINVFDPFVSTDMLFRAPLLKRSVSDNSTCSSGKRKIEKSKKLK